MGSKQGGLVCCRWKARQRPLPAPEFQCGPTRAGVAARTKPPLVFRTPSICSGLSQVGLLFFSARLLVGLLLSHSIWKGGTSYLIPYARGAPIISADIEVGHLLSHSICERGTSYLSRYARGGSSYLIPYLVGVLLSQHICSWGFSPSQQN